MADWEYYNPNPIEATVGDCAVRAIARALGMTWEDAYAALATNGFVMANMPSSDIVWGATLREHGFTRHMIPDTCPDCYTVSEFLDEHPRGTYVLKSEGHVCTAIDGVAYDTWNSLHKNPFYYWTNSKEDE